MIRRGRRAERRGVAGREQLSISKRSSHGALGERGYAAEPPEPSSCPRDQEGEEDEVGEDAGRGDAAGSVKKEGEVG